ncbi:stage II sporulation protein M [Dolichospermum sp. LEGE 00240]|uniref:stage II sporulation protein M n=1 Tax=Dolichospermum sp. LEGE 00240 TaxID=1828603 RepID=UPI0018829192|nr:stage II sporulation protein M [Dolichospermum sp. LEGE 00240]MBE9251069.1 stage II sporulation protein M [Dolichospermum sp. LEGE 00240]
MSQFQIIITAIFCIAIFSCWLVFSKGFNIGIAPIVAIVFFLLSLGLMFWVFLTPSGKNLARNYNKICNKIQLEKLKIESNYMEMMYDFKNLSTFQQVEEWDRKAQAKIGELINITKYLETELTQNNKILDYLIMGIKEQYIVFLASIVEKLQEFTDFTPNSPKEQKILLKELKQRKKELQLQKRELTANMKSIQADARLRSVYAGRDFLGIYNSKLAAHERRRIRYQKEEALRPSEDMKAAIDRQILQIDKDILWVERFSE